MPTQSHRFQHCLAACGCTVGVTFQHIAVIVSGHSGRPLAITAHHRLQARSGPASLTRRGVRSAEGKITLGELSSLAATKCLHTETKITSQEAENNFTGRVGHAARLWPRAPPGLARLLNIPCCSRTA